MNGQEKAISFIDGVISGLLQSEGSVNCLILHGESKNHLSHRLENPVSESSWQ